MKIARYKKAQKTLSFYRNNFGFREPYQILIDATFCQTALIFQISIKDQIPKYFQAETILVTTQCIILEAESLGAKVQGATNIVKQFLVHKCGHEKAPKNGIACIKSMIKNNRYVIATQDRELQDYLRKKPGQPIMYLHKKTPVLEQPSELSRKTVEFKLNESFKFGTADEKKLVAIKKSEGIPVAERDAQPKLKKKKKKQPNPLSCKKKKKKPGSSAAPKKASIDSIQDKTIGKKKRKRVKVPTHIKEILQSDK
ncbi:rRNA-processing protein UTP23 homolog [Sitodiplosis mosellana]|uniref:rRNA-processing protein UTP23 homolog n=1 Tax=Sitodiplosis mosellana TaxID=263140 RepID=UPI0024451AA4|nr:rRNA-processing protein UTP23 homolog [Sitodiplosis mosellana]